LQTAVATELLLTIFKVPTIMSMPSSEEGHQQQSNGTIRPLNFQSLGLTSSTGFLVSSYGSLTLEIVNNNNNTNAATATSSSTRTFLGGGEDINWSSRVSPESVYARLRRPATIPPEVQKKKTQKKKSAAVVAAQLTIPADARTVYSILWDDDFLFTFSVPENTQNSIT
jgi:hypothetical protein